MNDLLTSLQTLFSDKPFILYVLVFILVLLVFSVYFVKKNKKTNQVEEIEKENPPMTLKEKCVELDSIDKTEHNISKKEQNEKEEIVPDNDVQKASSEKQIKIDEEIKENKGLPSDELMPSTHDEPEKILAIEETKLAINEEPLVVTSMPKADRTNEHEITAESVSFSQVTEQEELISSSSFLQNTDKANVDFDDVQKLEANSVSFEQGKQEDQQREKSDKLHKPSEELPKQLDDSLKQSIDLPKQLDDSLKPSEDFSKQSDDLLKQSEELSNKCDVVENKIGKEVEAEVVLESLTPSISLSGDESKTPSIDKDSDLTLAPLTETIVEQTDIQKSAFTIEPESKPDIEKKSVETYTHSSANKVWTDLLEISNPKVHNILNYLATQGFHKPQVGLELHSLQNEIIGRLELGWPEVRVGIVLSEAEASIAKSQGWKTFTYDYVEEYRHVFHDYFKHLELD